jgi:hypothetical protein
MNFIRITVHCANPDCAATHQPAEFVGEYVVDDAVKQAGWSYSSVMVRSTGEHFDIECAPILACSDRCVDIVKALLLPIEAPTLEWIAPCRSGAS